MARTTAGTPTRRDCLRGGAIVGAGLLAGCTGARGPGTEGGSNGGSANASTTDGSDGSYTVTMAPMGTVAFDRVPESYVTYKEAYAEFGVALGVGDRLAATDRAYTDIEVLNDRFYSQLPGVEFPTKEVTDIYGGSDTIDKEAFYEVGADVHLMDPNLPVVYFDWDETDVEEVSQQVAPFFGNFIRRERDSEWGNPYEFYGLYEVFGKVAQVFDLEDRYEAFSTLHGEFRSEVRSRLPPEAERPTIGLLNSGSEPAKGTFYAMDPTDKGYEMKQYRDLGVKNAFAGVKTGKYGETDYETLLEVDPAQIYIHWGITYTDEEFEGQFVRPMEEDPVGSRLTAVKEGRIYKGGTAEQGPITNLFQTELLARQQYSGRFPRDKRLFNRERVAAIVTGDEGG